MVIVTMCVFANTLERKASVAPPRDGQALGNALPFPVGRCQWHPAVTGSPPSHNPGK